MANEVKEYIDDELYYRTDKKGERFSVEFCLKILNQNGERYSIEQAKLISDYLYQLAELSLLSNEISTTKIIELTKIKSSNEKSNSLYQSEYRRAS